MIHGIVSNALKDKKRPSHPSHASHASKIGSEPKALTQSAIIYSEIINGQGKKIDPYLYVYYLIQKKINFSLAYYKIRNEASPVLIPRKVVPNKTTNHSNTPSQSPNNPQPNRGIILIQFFSLLFFIFKGIFLELIFFSI